MHRRRMALLGALLVTGLLLAIALRSALRAPENFALGLEWKGLTADGYSAFAVSLTNRSLVPVVIKGIQFQWVDKAGRLDRCHAIKSEEKVQSHEVLSTYIAVPASASKLRVLFCGAPGPIRKQLTSFITKFFPERILRLVPSRWLLVDDIHCPFPWTANPSMQRAGASRYARLHFGGQRRLASAANAPRSAAEVFRGFK